MSYIYKYTVWFKADGVAQADAAVRTVPGLIEYDFHDIEEEE